jgi:hypothetical protein
MTGKGLAEARVRCQGQLHTIRLVKGVRGGEHLVLCDHANHDQSQKVVEILSGKRCRCHEVRDQWVALIQADGGSVSRPGSRHRKTVQRYGNLPAPLRPWAKIARQRFFSRRNSFWDDICCASYFADEEKAKGKSLLQALADEVRAGGGDSAETRAIYMLSQEIMWRATGKYKQMKDRWYKLFEAKDAGLSVYESARIESYSRAEPTLNVEVRSRYYGAKHLRINVLYADTVRSYLRTGNGFVFQPDGKAAIVIGIPRETYQRPCRGKPASELTLAWVLRQWRGKNWIITQALIRPLDAPRPHWLDVNEEPVQIGWEVEEWL